MNVRGHLTDERATLTARGTGEWMQGQKSWNISVTNEERGGAKGTAGIISGIPVSWNPFLLMTKLFKTN